MQNATTWLVLLDATFSHYHVLTCSSCNSNCSCSWTEISFIITVRPHPPTHPTRASILETNLACQANFGSFLWPNNTVSVGLVWFGMVLFGVVWFGFILLVFSLFPCTPISPSMALSKNFAQIFLTKIFLTNFFFKLESFLPIFFYLISILPNFLTKI